MKLTLNGKCSDMCFVSVDDVDGTTIHEEDGYAPYIAGLCGGDYIEFEIDTETGKVIGWDKEAFQEWLDEVKQKN